MYPSSSSDTWTVTTTIHERGFWGVMGSKRGKSSYLGPMSSFWSNQDSAPKCSWFLSHEDFAVGDSADQGVHCERKQRVRASLWELCHRGQHQKWVDSGAILVTQYLAKAESLSWISRRFGWHTAPSLHTCTSYMIWKPSMSPLRWSVMWSRQEVLLSQKWG